MLREARRKMNRRKPRSRREIVESLKEMIEAELVEPTSEGPQPQQTKDGKKGPRVASEPLQKPPGDTSRRSSLTHSADGGATPRRSSLTSDSGAPKKTPHIDTPRYAKDTVKKSLLRDKPGAGGAVKKRVTLPPLEGSKKDSAAKGNTQSKSKTRSKQLDGAETPRGRSSSVVDPALPQILEEREDTLATRESEGAPSSGLSSSHSRYVKREVAAASDGPTPPSGSAKRLPPLAKVSD